MESTRKTSVVVVASLAAAAAGIAVVVAVAKWRERNLVGDRMESGLRDVQDVLSDCYRKIDAIEQSLPQPSRAAVSGSGNRSSVVLRAMSNGNPAFEG